MPALRSSRLEQLLGGRVDESLTYDQVKGLISNAAEAPDLDFKRDLYSSSDRDRKALSVDVAAMANAGGGILIIGMDEDDQGRAAKDTGVTITDEEQRRIRQIVVGNVQPIPTFGVVPVEDPGRPGEGFMIIWVAKSGSTPHAYVQNKGLLFPRRIGTETVYLTEADVAQEYRARFAGFASRVDEAISVEADMVRNLSRGQVFVVVTLVPDLPGAFTIDTATFKDFQNQNAQRAPGAFGIRGRSFSISKVGRRRLIGTGTLKPNEPHSRIACELHQNGSGCYATSVERFAAADNSSDPSRVEDEDLVHGIATGVQFLAQHASVRARTGGLATLRAALYPVDGSRPVRLVENRSWQNEPVGSGEILHRLPVADTVADIDDLCINGAEFIAATYRLATGLFQEFGAPEAGQITGEGAIRLPYWDRGHHSTLVQWAEAVGVKALRTTID